MNPLVFTPLVKGLIVVGLIAAIAGGGFYEGHHMEAKVFQDFKDQQAAVAAKATAAAEAKARAAEQTQAAAQAAAQQQATVEKTEYENRANATIAQLRAGTLRLSNELASTRKAGVPQTASGAPGTVVASDAELPEDTAQFLVSEAERADDLAVNFNEAVTLLQQDRVTCNGGN